MEPGFVRTSFAAVLAFASAFAAAQGLRAPGASLASEGLLSAYWEQGGLQRFVEVARQGDEGRPLVGGWSHAFDADSQLSVGVGWQPGKTREEVGHLGGAAASWRQRFYGLWDPVVTAGVTFLRQDAQGGEAGADLYGAHLSVGLNPARDWGVSLGLGYRNAVDSLPFATFAERGDQMKLYGDLAAIYRVQRNLELQGQVSGLDLRAVGGREAEFSREIGIKMRYRFD